MNTKLCTYTLSALLALGLGFSTSARAQDADPEFSFSFTVGTNVVTGDIFETSGSVTELTVNPFTFTNNGQPPLSVPALEWTTSGGTNQGSLAIGAHTVTLGSNGLPSTYDISGVSYTPSGSSQSYSIGLDSNVITDFSPGYPYGTIIASGNPTFAAVPEPSSWALGLIALGGAFYLRRRALRA